jgi:uncharacterized membrane protein affecting hemolysin expression
MTRVILIILILAHHLISPEAATIDVFSIGDNGRPAGQAAERARRLVRQKARPHIDHRRHRHRHHAQADDLNCRHDGH